MRRWKLVAILVVANLAPLGTALAAELWPTARAAFEDGRSAYTQRRFVDALKAFEASLRLDPTAISLWVNIAEAHRRMGHCETALTKYQRFLDVAPKDEVWAKVEQRAQRLRKACPQATAAKPTDAVQAPEPGAPAVEQKPSAPASPQAEPPTRQAPASVTAPPAPPQPSPRAPAWQLAVQGGVAVQRWGEWTQNPHPTLRVSARHLMDGGTFGWAVGLLVEGSRRTYGSAAIAPGSFTGKPAWGLDALLRVDGRWHAARWLTLELGLMGGLTWVSALDPWNPVGPEGRATEGGALATLGATVSAEIPLTRALSLQVSPWAGTLSPSPEGAGPRLSFSSAIGLAYGW